MKTTRSKTIFSISAVAILLMMGCTNEPEQDNNLFYINVTVEKGSEYASEIDKVYAGIGNYSGYTAKKIAETAYGNGTFTNGQAI